MITYLVDRGLLQRTLILVALGWLLGVGVNRVRPTGSIPWTYAWSLRVENQARAKGIPLMDAGAVHAALQEGAHWALDARSPAEYFSGTLPGALSLPRADAPEQFVAIASLLSPEDPVITFCSGIDCDDAYLLAVFLREQSFTNVLLFVGGLEEWAAAGYALEGGP